MPMQKLMPVLKLELKLTPNMDAAEAGTTHHAIEDAVVTEVADVEATMVDTDHATGDSNFFSR